MIEIIGIIIVIVLIIGIFKLFKAVDLLIDIKWKQKEEIENIQGIQKILVQISDQIFMKDSDK